jgi:serine/threonine protein kinase
LPLSDIVHGDVKPQNVLVFRADDGSFTAKVADFGFSTRYAQDDTHIVLHQSWPWHAPEFDEYHEFTPVQALKTDVFSFGLLCLWFLFEESLSGILPLPMAAQWKSPSHVYKGEDFANQLVIAEVGFNNETKHMLQNYFGGCLASDPMVRDVDMQHSLQHMNIYP